jgi:hypothetical protein
MTVRELIDKLNSYPDYFKDEAQVFVERPNDEETYEITDIFDSMYHSVYIEIEKCKGE